MFTGVRGGGLVVWSSPPSLSPVLPRRIPCVPLSIQVLLFSSLLQSFWGEQSELSRASGQLRWSPPAHALGEPSGQAHVALPSL